MKSLFTFLLFTFITFQSFSQDGVNERIFLNKKLTTEEQLVIKFRFWYTEGTLEVYQWNEKIMEKTFKGDAEYSFKRLGLKGGSVHVLRKPNSIIVLFIEAEEDKKKLQELLNQGYNEENIVI